jgi:hypothetical protein
MSKLDQRTIEALAEDIHDATPVETRRMSDAKRGPTVTINAHDGTPEDVAALRAALELGLAWQAAEAAKPDDHTGPTIDRGFGAWSAEVWPPVSDDELYLDPIEGTGATPTAALRALITELQRRGA